MPKVLVGVTEAATGCGRLGGQLSAEQAAALRKRIGALVAQQGECFAYSAVTAEPDILFLEEVAAHGGGTNVILPFPVSEFRKRKAEFFPDDASRRRFERIVGAAARVVVAGEHRVSSNRVALEYTARMRNGLARLAARMLDAKIVPIVVGDPKQPRRAGPVSQTAGYWTASGVKPEMVELAGPDGGATAEEPMPPGFSQEIMAMLFGDVRGYSQLTEEQIPSFSEHFMGAVARTAATLKRAPVVKNSWGDALYFVFERVGDAAAFALNLFDAIAGVQWEKKGLPDDLTMRMALHAGPVYACRDPVTQTKNCVGWHVNRVARIEPVTPPGQVYASEAFAALAADEGVQGFACDYVGETALAKGFGVFPTYHVRRV
jgi:class 3 adenylate cyclase